MERGDDATDGSFTSVVLPAEGGTVEGRYYAADRAEAAVAYVGGVGGGWDTPARGLYPRLAQGLRARGIAGLRVRYRHPTDLHSCIADLGQGIRFLAQQGLTRVGLVGHSLGGAVVIEAGAAYPAVRTVVALSPQSFGADNVDRLAPRCSILFVHGMADAVLPARLSVFLHARAGEPKKLELLPHTGHGLDESADEVHDLVYAWLVAQLASSAAAPPGAARHS